tara:strand:- start:272 stop:643 length:372 start_codon:yes stop_codon:yes gene_type:complete
MPLITLSFPFDLNVSAQAGDTAYYVPTATSAAFDINSSDVIEIGIITNLPFAPAPGMVSAFEVNTNLVPALYPNNGDFILFSKDNKANMNGMLGYYTKVNMVNDSIDKAELFRVSADYNESSK